MRLRLKKPYKESMKWKIGFEKINKMDKWRRENT
jgi:hypothetical protein